MKLILAIIKPHQLENVKTALSKVKVFRLTIMDCQGFGRQHGQQDLVGGEDIALNLRRKIQLQLPSTMNSCNPPSKRSSNRRVPAKTERSATVKYSSLS